MNFAIAGCGMIARFHARAIREIPGARVAAVASRSEQTARRFAAEHAPDAQIAPDFQALAARGDVDAVCVCTPSGAHLEPALAAAKAGKHVIVEKPIEVALERADAMIYACRSRGARLGVVFPSRFAPAARALKEALAASRLGRPVLGSAHVKWWRPQKYYDEGGWKGTKGLDGGGALINQAIHAVDLLLWLMGPAARVGAFSARLAHERIEVEDTAALAVRFAGGALGVIEGTTGAWPGSLKRIEISGDRGSAVLEEERLKLWTGGPAGPEKVEEIGAQETGGGAGDPAAIGHRNHRLQIEEFIAAVRAGRDPAVSGEEGRKSLALILAAYRSAAQGRIVDIEGE